MLSIGLMSGTSMDGIDAALIATDGFFDVKEIEFHSLDYSAEFKILLKAAELAAHHYAGNLEMAEKNFLQVLELYLQKFLLLEPSVIQEQLKNLSRYFQVNTQYDLSLPNLINYSTQLHAECVKQLLAKTTFSERDISVIGYHGQTLFHSPAKKISLQVGNGKLLANLTGIKVVNNFREQDIALAGQGAPFAPLFHYALCMRDQIYPAFIINCGGIANITYVKNQNVNEVIAFDTGPGNSLLDRYVKMQTHGQQSMDKDGLLGMQGKVNNEILDLLYKKSVLIENKNYFDLNFPKSLDSHNLQLIPELNALSLPDACRTLEAFTADSIVKGILSLGENSAIWILAGGGWKNAVILNELLERKPAGVAVKTAKEVNWNSQSLEAQVFAYLAVRHLQQLPTSYPNLTHVSEAVCGGTLHSL